MRVHRPLLRTVGVLAVVALGACSDGSGGGSGSTETRRVTIYSGRTQNLLEPILKEFAEASGIDVDVRYGQSADLALLIDEEGAKTPADVFLSQTQGAVGYLDLKGRLGTLPDDVLDIVPKELHAADGSWVGFSGRKRVLAYDPRVLKEDELPATVLELTDPKWKGRLGVAPSNASFQDFVSAMRSRIGNEKTAAWLKGIADNDAFTFANNNAIVAAIDRGEIEMGLVNHYYVFQALDENPDFATRNHSFPDGDLGSLVIVTGASVIKTSSHKDDAVELVRYLLQERAQRYFSDQTYEYPLAAGVKPASVLPSVSFVQTDGIDLDKLGGSLDTTRAMIRDAGLEG